MEKVACAGWCSVDVMDGHFVPNISLGPDALKALRGAGVRLDAHLMVSDPGAFLDSFAQAGADWIIFHLEACPRPRPLLRKLRALGVGVGLAVNPKTPVEGLFPFLPDLDLALVMTVQPGFGGQPFQEKTLSKIRSLRAAIDRSRRPVWLQVDGGIGPRTAPLAAGAGADCLVSGSGVFGAKDPRAALKRLVRESQDAFDRRGR
jgi:ribulose-phosphate 3-epimerase